MVYWMPSKSMGSSHVIIVHFCCVHHISLPLNAFRYPGGPLTNLGRS